MSDIDWTDSGVLTVVVVLVTWFITPWILAYFGARKLDARRLIKRKDE